MPSPKKPFRINVGFIAHEEIGRNHDFPFEFDKIKLGDDFEVCATLMALSTLAERRKALVLQADFSAVTTLECVRCLTDFEHELDWSFTESIRLRPTLRNRIGTDPP